MQGFLRGIKRGGAGIDPQSCCTGTKNARSHLINLEARPRPSAQCAPDGVRGASGELYLEMDTDNADAVTGFRVLQPVEINSRPEPR